MEKSKKSLQFWLELFFGFLPVLLLTPFSVVFLVACLTAPEFSVIGFLVSLSGIIGFAGILMSMLKFYSSMDIPNTPVALCLGAGVMSALLLIMLTGGIGLVVMIFPISVAILHLIRIGEEE